MSGICRYCGCTEAAPCLLHDADGQPIVCSWLDEDQDLCTNPHCIAKAYHEAAEHVRREEVLDSVR